MPLSESPNQKALSDFCGTVCVHCKGTKKRGQSFCQRCYYSLPPNMRQALYRRFGSGYEEAYDAAKDWLRDNDG